MSDARYRLLTEVVRASAPIPCPDDEPDADRDSQDGREPESDRSRGWQDTGRNGSGEYWRLTYHPLVRPVVSAARDS